MGKHQTVTEPVAGRLQALMATTGVVDRAPIPADKATKLYNELRALCAESAKGLCDAECPDTLPSVEQVLLANISVADAVAAQIAVLQQALWAKAAKAGISDTRVAKARGVTQQAHSKVKKAQPK